MSGQRVPRAPGWRAEPALAALLWFLLPFGLARGQAPNPALAHLVRPAPGTRPLGAVLAELARQGQLPLSYSSSLVPVAHRCRLGPGPPRPLGAVLREVLAAEHLSYGLLNGQLVLWPDHVAAPAGVAAVNGRAARPRQPPVSPAFALPTLSTAAFAASPRAAEATAAAVGGRPAGPAAPAPGRGAPRTSLPARRARATAARSHAASKRPLGRGAAPTSTARPEKSVAGRSGPGARKVRPVPTTAHRVTAQLRGETALAAQSRGGRGRARRSPHVAQGKAPVSLVYPTRAHLAGQPQPRAGRVQGPLALLTPLSPAPMAALEPDGAVPAARLPTVLGFAPGQSPPTGPVLAADSAARKPLAPAGLPRRFYLHGEAWGSEALPLNVAMKLGIPRLYLVLGAAIGPFDRQSGGFAWGVGVGTAGRPRGRFTPSLDVMQWFLNGPPGDQDDTHGRLTQLRPALAWQLRPGGRWQLIGGPTLNLAAARRERGPARWPLGQDQWLWVNSDNGQSLLRLWPGVQLGLRF